MKELGKVATILLGAIVLGWLFWQMLTVTPTKAQMGIGALPKDLLWTDLIAPTVGWLRSRR